MGASGAIVMGFFGAGFASLTLLLQLHRNLPVLALPFLGFAALAIAAALVIRRPGDGFSRPEGSDRVMLWSSIGEGVVLFVVNVALSSSGHGELIIPAMALVVGLHFVPIAYWAPFPPLYALAAVLVGAGLAGLWVRQPAGGMLAGFTASAALMAASAAAIRRESAAKLR